MKTKTNIIENACGTFVKRQHEDYFVSLKYKNNNYY